MLNSYTLASSRIKIKSLYLTINRRKNLCIPYKAKKKKKIIKKSQKHSFLTQNAQFSTGMHMNQEIWKWLIQKLSKT